MNKTKCLNCKTQYQKERFLFDICPVCKGTNLREIKPKKYTYLKVLQGFYRGSYGWEDLTAEESFKEIKQRLKEYRENEGGTYRVINRRVLNVSQVAL
jgi:hypothetical protein